MRRLLLAVAAISASSCLPAKAQTYPWCAVYAMDGAPEVCSFVNFNQCMQTVRGIGGFCVVNTLYQPDGRGR